MSGIEEEATIEQPKITGDAGQNSVKRWLGSDRKGTTAPIVSFFDQQSGLSAMLLHVGVTPGGINDENN